MNEPFYCTFKCVTGEEVLCEICESDNSNDSFFMVSNPIVINESSVIDHQKGIMATSISPRKWMNFSGEDMTIVNRSHVVSMSEMDKFGVEFYNKALVAAKMSTPIKKKINMDDHLGYVGDVDDHRSKIQKMFDMSPDKKQEPEET